MRLVSLLNRLLTLEAELEAEGTNFDNLMLLL